MTRDVSGRLGTGTVFVTDLIGDIKKGQIKIPQFQRKFVWKEAQALNLLDSISRNYPTGSVLLWRTADKLATERNIGDFRLPDTQALSPTDYVLDGQQRMTVVYSCLGAPYDEPGFAADYDLVAERFVPHSEGRQLHLFPMRWLSQTTKLLDFRTALQTHSMAAELQPRLDAIVGIFEKYRIPVVTLTELTFEEVCPIFERINSSGTPLSLYDLMAAALWKRDFDLNDKVDEITSKLEAKGFGDLSGDVVLKCLSAINSKSIKRENVLELRKVDEDAMGDLVERTEEALLKTVDLLSTEFGIYSPDFLPYDAQLIVLAYCFATTGVMKKDQVARVRQWFWRSTFSERYRGASEHFISRDFTEIHEYVFDAKGASTTFGTLPVAGDLISLTFRKNHSRSIGFALALATLGPRNLTNGARIDCASSLSIFNKKEFHHIFPDAFLRRTLPKVERSRLPNFCMLTASENKVIADRDPKEYLPALIQSHGVDADAILQSNLFPSAKALDYSRVTYDEFCAMRSGLIAALVERLASGQDVTVATPPRH